MDNFISLESLQIATPCRADWNKMTGDERSRHCASCAKNVYNLSDMTKEEAERLIQEKEGHLCVRLHRRSDGTVITSDCPVGTAQFEKIPFPWKAMVVSLIASAVGLMGISMGAQTSMGAPSGPPPATAATATPSPQPPTVTLGMIAPPKPKAEPKRSEKSQEKQKISSR